VNLLLAEDDTVARMTLSAVLKGLGEDWIPGYKPAFNFQASLVDAVVRWLKLHPDWLAPAARMGMGKSQSALREEAMLWIGPPPTHSNARIGLPKATCPLCSAGPYKPHESAAPRAKMIQSIRWASKNYDVKLLDAVNN